MARKKINLTPTRFKRGLKNKKAGSSTVRGQRVIRKLVQNKLSPNKAQKRLIKAGIRSRARKTGRTLTKAQVGKRATRQNRALKKMGKGDT